MPPEAFECDNNRTPIYSSFESAILRLLLALSLDVSPRKSRSEECVRGSNGALAHALAPRTSSSGSSSTHTRKSRRWRKLEIYTKHNVSAGAAGTAAAADAECARDASSAKTCVPCCQVHYWPSHTRRERVVFIVCHCVRMNARMFCAAVSPATQPPQENNYAPTNAHMQPW